VFISVDLLYLFKYLFKGPDHTRFGLQILGSDGNVGTAVDEFEDFMNARYLSACEAVYRICGFDTVYKNPAVRCLPVHLEGENMGSMRHSTSAGFSTMSDLMWYFARPMLLVFQELTYFFVCITWKRYH
jgi:hypothetical protein